MLKRLLADRRVKTLTVLELSELVKALEEEFGVSAAPVAVAAPVAGAAAAAEEKTEFDVVLKLASTRQQDRGHQGRPRDHRPGPEGSQGCRRRRSQDPEGRRFQGRCRGYEEELKEAGAEGRSKVISFASKKQPPDRVAVFSANASFSRFTKPRGELPGCRKTVKSKNGENLVFSRGGVT